VIRDGAAAGAGGGGGSRCWASEPNHSSSGVTVVMIGLTVQLRTGALKHEHRGSVAVAAVAAVAGGVGDVGGAAGAAVTVSPGTTTRSVPGDSAAAGVVAVRMCA
jgi:hypothetical protein